MSQARIDPTIGVFRAALASRSIQVGFALSGTFLLAAIVSFFWTPFDVEAIAIKDRLQTPNAVHWLGTDHFGRDIFSMVMVGARTSIAVAFISVSIGVTLGVPLGLTAAMRRGGTVDEVIMRTNDLIFAFPSLVIAILIAAVFGPGAMNAIVAIGVFNIPVFARVARGAALSLLAREFVMAARVAGKSSTRIAVEHLLPNITNLLIVQATIQFCFAIAVEAAVSYVGLGTQPPTPSWGRMLAEAQTMISFAPHVAIFPGLAIMLTVLGLNLMGDGLRDVFDPRLRRER